MEKNIATTREEDTKLKAEWEEKKVELRARETKVKESEEILAKAREVFREETKEQREDREKLDIAMVAFKEALKTITW